MQFKLNRHTNEVRQRAGQPGPRPRNVRNRDTSNPPSPNRIFTYYANRSQSEQVTGREAVQAKAPLRRLPSRLQRLRRHGGWFAAAIALMAIGVYELQLSTSPKVISLASSADTPFLQDMQVYQEAAHKLLDSNAINRNKLTINVSGIADDLQKQFPELQAVSLSLPVFGDKPEIYIRPAEPSLVLAASNGTYVIDDNGRALAEATAGANLSRLKIPTVTDQSSLQIRLGEQVLPRTVTSFVSSLVTQLKAQNIEVQSMIMPASAGELDVYLAGKAYFVKFNTQQGGADIAAEQAGTFVAASKQLDKNREVPSQYIDVRLEGRAYYR